MRILKNDVLVNVLFLSSDKAIRLLLGIYVLGALAKHLGANDYGVFAYSLSIIAILEVFCSLGLRSIIVSKISLKELPLSSVIGTSICLKMTSSFSVLCLSLFSIYIFNWNSSEAQLILILLVSLIFKSFNCIQYAFEAKVLSKYTVIVESFVFLSFCAVKLYFINIGSGIKVFGYIFVCEALVTSILLSVILDRKLIRFKDLTINHSIANELLSKSWPLIISSAAWILYTRMDLVIISSILNNESVGIYSVVIKFGDLIVVLPSLIAISMLPKIKKTFNVDKYLESFQRVYDYVTYITYAMILFIYLMSDWLVELVFGTDFSEASSVLLVYCLGAVFISQAVISGRYLVYEGMQKITMYRHLLGLAINFPLNIYLIPIYGLYGAAYATVLSLFFSNLILDYFHTKTKICFSQKIRSILMMNIYKHSKKIIRKYYA